MLVFINVVIAILTIGLGFAIGSLWILNDLSKYHEGDDEE